MAVATVASRRPVPTRGTTRAGNEGEDGARGRRAGTSWRVEATTVNLAVLVPGVLIAAGGVASLLFPRRLVGLAAGLVAHRSAKWIAGGLRLVLGAFILGGSARTAHPVAVAAVGGLLALVGATLLVLPRARFEAVARWGLGLSTGAIRLASLAAIVLGGWLSFAATRMPI